MSQTRGKGLLISIRTPHTNTMIATELPVLQYRPHVAINLPPLADILLLELDDKKHNLVILLVLDECFRARPVESMTWAQLQALFSIDLGHLHSTNLVHDRVASLSVVTVSARYLS